jgi:hypothetical protein
MSERPTVESVLAFAATTHATASALAGSSRWWSGWHERKLARATRAFLDAAESLPPPEAARLTEDDRMRLNRSIDAIIEDVERFIASHGAASRRRLEQDRDLVKQIYEMRRVFELLSRHITADPGTSDMRFEMKVDPSRRR